MERVTVGQEMVALREAYLVAGVVGEKWRDDALHVAAATVARADVLVSWNFRHLVNLNKARSYNAVNLTQRYPMLTIASPLEVVAYDDEDI